MALIIRSNPCWNMPAGQAGVGGRRRRRCWLRRGGCCCWMLLSHIPLTQVGDSYPAERAPGQSGEGDSHQSKFTFFISPHKPFSFQAPLLLLWNAALLGTEHGASLCESVCFCVRGLIPCYPKTFSFFCESGFQWKGEPSVSVLFFLAAYGSQGFSPIFVYNTDTADFLLSSNFSIMCPLANSNYNSLDRI